MPLRFPAAPLILAVRPQTATFASRAARWLAPTRWPALLSVTLFVLYALGVALGAWFFPFANWDTIAYAAATLPDGLGVAEVHREAYAAVRAELEPGRYMTLVGDRPYRVRQAADPAAFVSMLPFYETKLLYVLAAKALRPFAGVYDALRLVSAGSALALAAVCLLWLARSGAACWAGALAGILAVSQFGSIAANTVPDIFAAIFVALAGWAFVARRDALAALAMTLAVLARPDHVAFAGVLAVVALASGARVIPQVATLLAACAAYLLASGVADHPGWWVQFNFTNVGYTETLEGFDPAFSVVVYAKAFALSAARALVREPWPFVVLALFALALWLGPARAVLTRRETTLAVALALTFAAKYAIFPLHETRFHIAYIALGATMLLAALPRTGVGARNEGDARQRLPIGVSASR